MPTSGLGAIDINASVEVRAQAASARCSREGNVLAESEQARLLSWPGTFSVTVV
jgi:hypothetical protein